MSANSVSHRELEAFRAVMKAGSTISAAQRLNTSQPSISRLIGELERKTGLRLFERQGGRLTPTESGTIFFKEVEASFVGVDQLSTFAREIALFGTGRLRLAASPVIALSVLPLVTGQFKRDFPNVTISVEMRTETTVRRWTMFGQCDVGMSSGSSEMGKGGVYELYSLSAVCVVPRDHPLSEREEIHVKDLHNVPMILPSRSDETRFKIEGMFSDANATLIPAVESPYGAVICGMAAQGIGIGIVNPLASKFPVWPDIVIRPLKPLLPFRGYAMIADTPRDRSLAERFVEATRVWVANQHLQVLDALSLTGRT